MHPGPVKRLESPMGRLRSTPKGVPARTEKRGKRYPSLSSNIPPSSHPFTPSDGRGERICPRDLPGAIDTSFGNIEVRRSATQLQIEPVETGDEFDSESPKAVVELVSMLLPQV